MIFTKCFFVNLLYPFKDNEYYQFERLNTFYYTLYRIYFNLLILSNPLNET